MSVSKSTPKEILEALKAALAAGPAQKRGDAFYKPRPQPYWYHNGSSWTSSSTSTAPVQSNPEINPQAIRLASWNIDMLIGFAEERMSAALEHLSSLAASTPASTPLIIFLQEMSQSDLRQIRDAAWIQERFFITDLDESNWGTPLYGTTTLVDRRLSIAGVFRVPWISNFSRDGLFVDIALAASLSPAPTLRLCNTHLESLVADPPVRPRQLQAAAPYLHDKPAAAALLAGDLNAIQPFDRTLHAENGLRDAYLELGGGEDSDEGYTWGYQVPQAERDRFGCSRMDKILFAGALRPVAFERIGVGVKVAEEHRQRMRDAGAEEWVTDHYGVIGDFELTNGWVLCGEGAEAGVRSKLA